MISWKHDDFTLQLETEPSHFSRVTARRFRSFAFAENKNENPTWLDKPVNMPARLKRRYVTRRPDVWEVRLAAGWEQEHLAASDFLWLLLKVCSSIVRSFLQSCWPCHKRSATKPPGNISTKVHVGSWNAWRGCCCLWSHFEAVFSACLSYIELLITDDLLTLLTPPVQQG